MKFLFLFLLSVLVMHDSQAKTIDELSNDFFNESKALFPCVDRTIKYENDVIFANCNDLKVEQKVKKLFKKYNKALKLYNQNNMTKKEIVSYKMLRSMVNDGAIGSYQIKKLLPINQIFSDHIMFLNWGSSQHKFETKEDYYNWAEKMTTLSYFIKSSIKVMRDGIDKNITLQRSLVERVISQFESLIKVNLTESAFYYPITLLEQNPNISEKDKKDIIEIYQSKIRDVINPSYTLMLNFLKGEYISKSSSDTGLWQFDGGLEYYDFLLKSNTQSEFNADEIHQIGLAEVKKIADEISKIKVKQKFKGTLTDYINYKKKNQKTFSSEESLFKKLYTIRDTVNKNVHKFFSIKIKTPLEIRKVDDSIADGASPYYMPGDSKKSMPGVFFVPIINLKDFGSENTMDALYLHEAIPGHHYQISIQDEDQSINNLIKNSFNVAMAEGWALYTESLGKELGLYKTDDDYLGYLDMSMMRAVRLVVDTGLHTKKWTKEQAMDYSRQYLAQSDAEIENSIERYMAIPGQALSYKMGYFKIIEMRDKAKKELGDKFDIISFHDELIRHGSVTLDGWEYIIDEWKKELKEKNS